MGQAGHKVGDHRSAVESCRRRTNERSSDDQACVNQSVTPSKNGKMLTQKETRDDEQRFAVDDHSSFVEVSNCEYELYEKDDESAMTPEPSSSLSVDELKHAWFDSARGEVTLGADFEKRVSTRSPAEQQFQEIWSTNVDFSSIRCSFTMSSASEDQSLGELTLSEENNRQIIVEKDRPGNDEKGVDAESCWVMEFGQKEREEVGVSGCDASRIPTSDDFASGIADEKNCYFQFVEDDLDTLPTVCFDDDYDEEKDSIAISAKISFTDEEEREGGPVCTEMSEVCEKREKGETVQKRSLSEKCLEKNDDRRMVYKVDDGIESLDRSSLDTEGTTEVDTEGGSPADSMVKRVCSTVKRGFLSAFMRQWSRDVKKIDEEDDDQRQKKRTFLNPTEVLGEEPPSANMISMKSMVGAVLSEAKDVEQDVHPYGRGNIYRNAFAGKRSLVQIHPAKLMFWGIVVCMVTGAAFGVIILSEIHRGSLRRLLKRYNGSYPDWY